MRIQLVGYLYQLACNQQHECVNIIKCSYVSNIYCIPFICGLFSRVVSDCRPDVIAKMLCGCIVSAGFVQDSLAGGVLGSDSDLDTFTLIWKNYNTYHIRFLYTKFFLQVCCRLADNLRRWVPDISVCLYFTMNQNMTTRFIG